MIEDTIKNLTVAIDGLNETLRAMQVIAHLGLKPAPVVEIPKVEANATIAKLKAQAKAAKVETPAPAPAPTPAPEPAPEPVAETKKVDLADLTILAQKCLDFDGLAALRELNAKHGIERISKTPDDKLAAVHADLVALYARISAPAQ